LNGISSSVDQPDLIAHDVDDFMVAFDHATVIPVVHAGGTALQISPGGQHPDPAVLLPGIGGNVAHALSENTLSRLGQVVEKNPDLIILTDDVYGTFAEDFRTVYAVLPFNTILVYSFSKLYGVTDWRVGLIAMNERNVCDRLLGELPEADKEYLRQEYAIVTTDPDSMPFLDRVVADSSKRRFAAGRLVFPYPEKP